MRPTAIKTHQGSVLFQQKSMVFWTEDFATKRFENDALFGQRSRGFVQFEVASFAGQNGGVLFGVVLSQPKRMDGDGQGLTPVG